MFRKLLYEIKFYLLSYTTFCIIILLGQHAVCQANINLRFRNTLQKLGAHFQIPVFTESPNSLRYSDKAQDSDIRWIYKWMVEKENKLRNQTCHNKAQPTTLVHTEQLDVTVKYVPHSSLNFERNATVYSINQHPQLKHVLLI
jgi:hypothetical protein